jgi:hypothetical protein
VEKKTRHEGEKNLTGGGGNTLLKGVVGTRRRGGGQGKSGDVWRGSRRGDSSGGVAWPAAARSRCACPHSGGWHRVTDEQGLDGSGRARGVRGPAGEGNGVGRARMNSDDF